MKVIGVMPGIEAKVIDIEGGLDSMQAYVGGLIEEIMPFDDDVALICNEEGKMLGMDLNRAIYIDGQLVDIIAGPFFICYAPSDSDSFLDMPNELIKKYLSQFKYPEMFYRIPGGGIQVVRNKA